MLDEQKKINEIEARLRSLRPTIDQLLNSRQEIRNNLLREQGTASFMVMFGHPGALPQPMGGVIGNVSRALYFLDALNQVENQLNFYLPSLRSMVEEYEELTGLYYPDVAGWPGLKYLLEEYGK